MDNKTLFTNAHKLARENVATIGDYRLAFKWALSEIKAQEAQESKCNYRAIFSALLSDSFLECSIGGLSAMLIVFLVFVCVLLGGSLLAQIIGCVFVAAGVGVVVYESICTFKYEYQTSVEFYKSINA